MLQLPTTPSIDIEVADERRKISRDLWRFASDLLAALRNRLSVDGTVTFAAATTATVTFTTAEPNANYRVYYASPEDNYLWTTSPTTTGFTANAKNSTSATFGWQLKRS